jgi:carbamoyltransferase
MTPLMTTTRRVHPERAAASAETTHIDGSARVQTVAEDGSPFAALLLAMEAETGNPLVLNTSLNAAGDPMVATGSQLLSFLASHHIDGVLVDDVWVTLP